MQGADLVKALDRFSHEPIADNSIRRALIYRVLASLGLQFQHRPDILGKDNPFANNFRRTMASLDEIEYRDLQRKDRQERAETYVQQTIYIGRFLRMQVTPGDIDILAQALEISQVEDSRNDYFMLIHEIPRSTFFVAAKESPETYKRFLTALSSGIDNATLRNEYKANTLLKILSPFLETKWTRLSGKVTKISPFQHAKRVQLSEKTLRLLSHGLGYGLRPPNEDSLDSKGQMRSLIDDVQIFYISQDEYIEPKNEGIASLMEKLYEIGYYPDIELDGHLPKWPDREITDLIAKDLMAKIFSVQRITQDAWVPLAVKVSGFNLSLSAKTKHGRPLVIIHVLPIGTDYEIDKIHSTSL